MNAVIFDKDGHILRIGGVKNKKELRDWLIKHPQKDIIFYVRYGKRNYFWKDIYAM